MFFLSHMVDGQGGGGHWGFRLVCAGRLAAGKLELLEKFWKNAGEMVNE